MTSLPDNIHHLPEYHILEMKSTTSTSEWKPLAQ